MCVEMETSARGWCEIERERAEANEGVSEWSLEKEWQGKAEGASNQREDVALAAIEWWLYVCRSVSKLVVLRGQIRCTMKK